MKSTTFATSQIYAGALLMQVASGFMSLPKIERSVPLLRPSRTIHRMAPDWTSLTTAIEYFDGSQVVDPIVVSNVFWDSLQAKLLSVIIGQLIATLVFGLLTSLAAQQVSKLGSFVSGKVFQQEPSFRKLPDLSSRRVVQPDFGKLLVCILVDSIGTSSELIPVLGEVTDVVWAPIAGIILRSLFYNSNILFGLELVEEILPFTDILPLATICWTVDTFFGDTSLAKLLNLGQYSRETADQARSASVALGDDDELQISRRDGSLRP